MKNAKNPFAVRVIAVATAVIAINLTWTNWSKPVPAQATILGHQPVAEVVGKVTTVNPFGSSTRGYLVRTGSGLQLVPYDNGSAADIMETPSLMLYQEEPDQLQRQYLPLRRLP